MRPDGAVDGDLEIAERRLATASERNAGRGDAGRLSGHAARAARSNRTALQCVRQALESPQSFGHTHHTYYSIACIYAELGDTEKAMAWLERSVDNGFPCWPFFRVDPFLEHLRDEPAFIQLMASLEQTYTAIDIRRL